MCADHLKGRTSDAPEAKLQLALDVPSLTASLGTVCALRPRLGRVEVGTPLLLHAGVAAIELVRSVLPSGVRLVADTKICDGGNRIALDSFNAGADVVTVAGVAVDAPTWRGVLEAAMSLPEASRTVLIDTVGWDNNSAGPRLRRLTEEAVLAGVPVEVCVHRPKDDPPPLPELFRQFGGPTSTGVHRRLIAGKIVSGLVAPALEAGFDVVVVGGAVSDSDDPARAWSALLEEVPAPGAGSIGPS
jgi:3-hexulose-6-phosphate synthase